jgi:hypothetical protein
MPVAGQSSFGRQQGGVLSLNHAELSALVKRFYKKSSKEFSSDRRPDEVSATDVRGHLNAADTAAAVPEGEVDVVNYTVFAGAVGQGRREMAATRQRPCASAEGGTGDGADTWPIVKDPTGTVTPV